MVHSFTRQANAKINLFLRITGILDGGYHSLMSLMQEISLCDELKIEVDDSGSGNCTFECVNVPELSGNDNLCVRAYELFASYLRDADVFIKLKKVIPSQAGLGGGSSDAAIVMKVLQEYCGNPYTEEELISMAKGLGADVPFFLFGGTCICEGVGEKITKVKTLSGLNLLVVKPKEGVSTPACFKLFDSKGPAVSYDEGLYLPAEGIFNGGRSSEVTFEKVRPLLINDLEKPAEELVPTIKEIKDRLTENGCLFTMMSGSGSSVFAVFENKKEAAEAASLFPDMDTFVCETV